MLADKSTTEFPRYWIEQPDLFCAPAREETPEKRILAVLKWFLSSLKGQQYAGRSPSEGIKKPLNAFLGELFLGDCGDGEHQCRLVSEQVSHHPPVTACYLWNDQFGVRAEGYTRQEITFNGSVNIQQIGHAVLHLDRWEEDYLIPLPDIKVKGVLTGSPYPELHGSYTIVSSSGYVAVVDFTGKGMFGFGGKKNHVEAHVFRSDDTAHKNAIFTVEGSWSESFTFKDASGSVIDEYNVASQISTDFRTLPLEQQDPWESRKAWQGVIDSIHKGHMQGVADHKSKLENAQREMRKHPETAETKWQAVFFRKASDNVVARRLMEVVGQKLDAQSTCGIWQFDKKAAAEMQKPLRGQLTPFG